MPNEQLVKNLLSRVDQLERRIEVLTSGRSSTGRRVDVMTNNEIEQFVSDEQRRIYRIRRTQR